MISLPTAMRDPHLFGPWFSDPSWNSWRCFIAALFGLPVQDHGRERLYQNATGRTLWPREQARECFVVAGRRSGKSRIAALVSIFLTCFFDRRDALAPGEIGTCMLLAGDRAQARTLMRYCKGLIQAVPLLEQMVVAIKSESIEFNNSTCIEIHTSSYSSVRSYTCIGVVLDELAFWPSAEDGSNPAEEAVAAIRPSLATIKGSLLLGISSPYRRSGPLWEAYRKWYGQYGPVLIWRSDSRSMNPTLPAEIVEQAMEEDPQRASSEYLAEFRSDIASFVDREAAEACVVQGRRELPRLPNIAYYGFIDAAGGSGGDSFSLCIAHQADGQVIIDCIRERRPPFSPDDVTREFSETLKAYGCYSCTADKYSGEWVRERFAAVNINVSQSARPKSELYLELLPLLNSSRIQLLDNQRCITQLCSLERRTSRSGRDSIDHPPYGGARDDVINSVAGAAHLCRVRQPINPDDWAWGEIYEPDPGAVLAGSGMETEFISWTDF